ncbi:MAG: Mut7-C RNAse domain-containing protein [candidate division KSB1 bacterium]|nr:Mut7-C RNAse domain-containing protein [candidate division KSB1 bacterium]
MKFAVDVMLGKLAKWLRIIGYDAEYSRSWTDAELRSKATSEQRLVLTRDKALANSLKPGRSLFIESQQVREQFRQVVEAFDLDTEQGLFTLCTICNRRVEPVSLETVGDQVAGFVRHHQRSFWRCPQCGRIYWEGSHIVNARGWIASALEKSRGNRAGDPGRE